MPECKPGLESSDPGNKHWATLIHRMCGTTINFTRRITLVVYMGYVWQKAKFSVPWYTREGDHEPACPVCLMVAVHDVFTVSVCGHSLRHHTAQLLLCCAMLCPFYCFSVRYCWWFRNLTTRCLCCKRTHVFCRQSDNDCIDLWNWQLCFKKSTFS